MLSMCKIQTERSNPMIAGSAICGVIGLVIMPIGLAIVAVVYAERGVRK